MMPIRHLHGCWWQCRWVGAGKRVRSPGVLVADNREGRSRGRWGEWVDRSRSAAERGGEFLGDQVDGAAGADAEDRDGYLFGRDHREDRCVAVDAAVVADRTAAWPPVLFDDVGAQAVTGRDLGGQLHRPGRWEDLPTVEPVPPPCERRGVGGDAAGGARCAGHRPIRKECAVGYRVGEAFRAVAGGCLLYTSDA